MNSEDILETRINFTNCPQTIDEALEKNKINLAAVKKDIDEKIRLQTISDKEHKDEEKRKDDELKIKISEKEARKTELRQEKEDLHKRLGKHIFDFFCDAPDEVYLTAIEQKGVNAGLYPKDIKGTFANSDEFILFSSISRFVGGEPNEIAASCYPLDYGTFLDSGVITERELTYRVRDSLLLCERNKLFPTQTIERSGSEFDGWTISMVPISRTLFGAAYVSGTKIVLRKKTSGSNWCTIC